MSSRELAGLAWFLIVIAWAYFKKPSGVGDSVRLLVKTIFSRQILSVSFLVIGYNAAVVWGLWRIGYWDTQFLWDTVVFVAIGGFGSVLNASPREVTYNSRFFAKTILVNLEIMVLVVFLADLYAFHFLIEFFVVVPFVTMLLALLVVSERMKGYEQVHRFLVGIQAFVGIALLVYLGGRVFAEFRDLMHLRTLYELMLPLVLSVCFLPLLFLICALFAYEDAGLLITFKQQEKRLARWKKRRLFLRFGLNIKKLQTFRGSPAIHEYAWVKSKEEARNILRSWTSKQPPLGEVNQ